MNSQGLTTIEGAKVFTPLERHCVLCCNVIYFVMCGYNRIHYHKLSLSYMSLRFIQMHMFTVQALFGYPL